MSNCNCSKEIMCDGSGRLQRYLKALDPQYTPIDGRNMEELLVYAKRYAAQIRFYPINDDIKNTPAGEAESWKEFFRRDLAVITASIGVTDCKKVRKDYDEIRNDLYVKADPDIFAALLDPILGIAARLDAWYSLSLPGNPLFADIELSMKSKLKQQVLKIKAYTDAYKLIDNKHPLTPDFSKIKNVDLWGINEPVQPDASIYAGANYADKVRHAALYFDDIFNVFYKTLEELVNHSEAYLQYAMEQYPEHKPHMALFISFLQLFLIAQEQLNGITERMLNFYYRDVLHLMVKPAMPDHAHVVFELAKGVSEYAMAAGTNLKAEKDANGIEQIYATENEIVINRAKVKELKTIFINKIIRPANADIKEATLIDAFYARPVANSKDGFGAAFDEPSGKWPTFGIGRKPVIAAGSICDKINDRLEENSRIDQAQIGFAVASPQLLLQGGKRLIRFQCNDVQKIFKDFLSANKQNNIEIWLTGEKGWMKITDVISEENFKNYISPAITTGIFEAEPKDIKSSLYIGNELTFIYLPISEKSVVGFDAELHTDFRMGTSLPVICFMLKSSLGIDEVDYNSFKMDNISISVKVGSINTDENKGRLPNMDGLKTMVLQNDDGPIAPDKPFDPFTALPSYGKSLYIGSDEVFNKNVNRLSVNIRPVQAAVEEVVVNSPVLKAMSTNGLDVNLLYKKEWLRLATKSNADFTIYQLAKNILFLKNFNNGNAVPYVTMRNPITYNETLNDKTEKGFLSITLPNVSISVGDNESAIQKRMELGQKYKIKEISLNYESSLYSLENGIDQVFHIYPFGVIETNIVTDSKKEELIVLKKPTDSLIVNAGGILLPQFTYFDPYSLFRSTGRKVITNIDVARDTGKYIQLYEKTAIKKRQLAAEMILDTNKKLSANYDQYSSDRQESGMLFIGLENLKPLQTVSLLFQFAEGSAEDEENNPPEIHWSYLSNNRWHPLPGENIVSDGTYGFQTTGIIKYDIPADATTNNTIITPGLIWLCASVSEHAERIPQLINILAQAVQVQFTDQGNAPSHYDEALPAGSISKMDRTAKQVSTVQQPFASFDGKHSEKGKEFYMRVSERLRHKGRAVTSWDYEHLVLNRFPQIYKVKCITHTDPECICRKKERKNANGQDMETCCGSQVAPGHVLVVPISDLKNRNAINPLQPKTSKRTLLAIEDYLSKRTSPFVKVHAKNPKYEQVIVYFQVQFYTGIDKGYYLKKLNEEIVQFLTPWAFNELADVQFNQKIYASSVINFIEERAYVDFITDFKMAVCDNPCCAPAEPVRDGKDKSPAEIFSSIHNCNEWESFLENALSASSGEIVVTPSTARSILVSVPKHIIVPYVAYPEISPCDKRKISDNRLIDVEKDVIIKDVNEKKERPIKAATNIKETGVANSRTNIKAIEVSKTRVIAKIKKPVATKKSVAKKSTKK